MQKRPRSIVLVVAIPLLVVACNSASNSFNPSPAQYSAMVIDAVKNLPCGRPTDAAPVTAGAWIVDDPSKSHNRAIVAIKIRIADDWFLVVQAPDGAPHTDLQFEFFSETQIDVREDLKAPDPEFRDFGDVLGSFLIYDADNEFNVNFDDEGYRLIIIQQPVRWIGSDKPTEINVRLSYSALTENKQIEPTTLVVTARPLQN